MRVTIKDLSTKIKKGSKARYRLESFLATLTNEQHNLLIILLKEDHRIARDLIEELGGSRWMARRIKIVQ